MRGVRTSGDPFDNPFSIFQRQVLERASKPLVIKVLSIPGDQLLDGAEEGAQGHVLDARQPLAGGFPVQPLKHAM